MRVTNKTRYDTRAMRQHLRYACTALDVDPSRVAVTVKYARSMAAAIDCIELPDHATIVARSFYWAALVVANRTRIKEGRDKLPAGPIRHAQNTMPSTLPDVHAHAERVDPKLRLSERQKLAHDERLLAGWQSKAKRAANAIAKYERRIRARKRRIDSGDADVADAIRALREAP